MTVHIITLMITLLTVMVIVHSLVKTTVHVLVMCGKLFLYIDDQ